MFQRSNNPISEDCKLHSANAIFDAMNTLKELEAAQEGQEDPKSPYYEMDDAQVLKKLGLQTHYMTDTASSAELRAGSGLKIVRIDLSLEDHIEKQEFAINMYVARYNYGFQGSFKSINATQKEATLKEISAKYKFDQEKNTAEVEAEVKREIPRP